jgi:hypothetical protein
VPLYNTFLTAREEGEMNWPQGSIFWKIPPPLGGGKYQPMSFGGKNMNRGREKGGKYIRKRKKGERK